MSTQVVGLRIRNTCLPVCAFVDLELQWVLEIDMDCNRHDR